MPVTDDDLPDEVPDDVRRRRLTASGSASVRLARPEVPIDAYRSANILLRQHGEGARDVAGARLQAMLDAADEGGVAAWTDILYALGELTRGPREGEARN